MDAYINPKDEATTQQLEWEEKVITMEYLTSLEAAWDGRDDMASRMAKRIADRILIENDCREIIEI